MWQAAYIAAVVFVLPGSVVANVINEEELNRIANDIEFELEVKFQQEVHRQNLQRHQRHRHRHHSFLHRPGASVLMQADPKDLPKLRHPAVAKHLKGMSHEMHNLEGRHHLAKKAREHLEGEVKNAAKHVNKVVSIKSDLAHTEVQIRVEERKLRRLEEDLLRLDTTHQSLVSSLHRIMDPKIKFAKERLKHRQAQLHKLQAQAAEWKANEDKYHSASLASIQQRDVSKEHVLAAEAAQEKARKDLILAEADFHAAKKSTNLNIERYRYSQAEAKATDDKEHRSAKETKDEEDAVMRLNRILHMEQSRVDESMAIGKDRVRGKMQEIQKREEKSHSRLAKLKQTYTEWRNSNLKWENHLAATHDNTDFASRFYEDAQRQMVDTANDQAVMEAESDTDWAWDDWAKE